MYFIKNVNRNFLEFDIFSSSMKEKYINISITLLLNVKKCILVQYFKFLRKRWTIE